MKISLKKGLPRLEAMLEAGLLGAQNTDHPAVGSECLYSYPGTPFRCAIGAMLGPRQISRVLKDNANNADFASILDVSDEEFTLISRLQGAHDEWLAGESNEVGFRAVLSEISKAAS